MDDLDAGGLVSTVSPFSRKTPSLKSQHVFPIVPFPQQFGAALAPDVVVKATQA